MDGGAMPTDEEMQVQVYEIYYEVLSEGINEGMMYGEAKDVTLHVKKNDGGDYEIDDGDMKTLDGLLIEDYRRRVLSVISEALSYPAASI